VSALRTARSVGWLPWFALAAVWFATLQVRPLFDPDEVRYAEIPREMLASGDWITPRLDGLKYFEKPPLQYWATAAAYSVFGFSEWTARLWTVGLGFLCLPMTYAWVARLYGRRAGLAALVALAVSPYFEIVGHLNLLDAGFSFWLCATLFAFTLAQTAPDHSPEERKWMLLAWLSAALAILSKGIVVGVLAGATLVAYSVLERDVRAWRRLHLASGVPLFALVAAPWFIAVSLRNPSFAQFFFIHEHFARFLTTVHQRIEPWWFFLMLLVIAVLPWIGQLRRAVWTGWSEVSEDNSFKPLKFLIIFSVVTVVFFSLSGSKLAPYILPAMPPLAAVVAAGTADWSRFMSRVGLFAGCFTLVIGAGLSIYLLRAQAALPAPAVGWLAAAVLAALIGMLAAVKSTASQREWSAWTIAASAIFAWQCLLSVFGEGHPQRSAYQMLQPVRPLIRPETQLFSIGQYRETISPYLARELTLVDFEGELAFGLAQEPAKVVTPEAFLEKWRASKDAIAFLDPAALGQWQERGLSGRVVSADESTVAVSRL